MKTVIDTLFLRRPPLNYLSPGICEAIFSSTGSPIIILPDFHRRKGPTGLVITGAFGHRVLRWNAYPDALCYNIYEAECSPTVAPENLSYHLIAECISVTEFDLPGEGCYRVSAITPEGESDLSDPLCTCEHPVPPPPDKHTPVLTNVVCGLLSWTVEGTQPDTASIEQSNDEITWSAFAEVPWADGSHPANTDFKYRVIGITGGTQVSNYSNVVSIALHATAIAWRDRVVFHGGGEPSLNTMRAQSDFCCYLDRNNLRSKILMFNSFVPDSFIAGTSPLFTVVTDGFLDPWINNHFVNADLNVNGLKGDPTPPGKWLRTGFTPFGRYVDSNSASLFVMLSDAAVANGGIAMGAGFASREMALYPSENAKTNSIFTCWSNPATRVDGAAGPSGSQAGFFLGTRTAVNLNTLYFANSGNPWASLGSNVAVEAVGAEFYEIYVFAFDDAVLDATAFTDRRISAAGTGTGLTSTEGKLLYEGIQALRTALGGGFV